MIRASVRTFAIGAALSCAASAFGDCHAPHYRRGRVLVDKQSDIVFFISIRLGDFTPERLICLAGALRREFPGRNVSASVFISHRAALSYVPGDIDAPQAAKEAQPKLHGSYDYDKKTHEEHVDILPDGDNSGPEIITRIDLPVTTGTPACKVAVNGRCLLELRHIRYPPGGEIAADGQVTLTGSIRRDGTMAGVAVVDAKADPPSRQTFLDNFAAGYLRTWRFEPGKREDGVRNTFDFEITLSPLPGGQRVEFHLPGEVRVQTNLVL